MGMTEQEKREKVIKGLGCCITNGIAPDCEECPYAERDGTCVMLDPMLRDALELLKAEDETRLVMHFSRPNVYADLWQHCEKCGEKVDTRWHPKYCPGCGRKVKWE